LIDPAERVPLGRSGLSVSRLGFGSAPLGGLFRATSGADARAAVDAAWSAGLRYFDTAPQYGSGLAEQRLGAALRGRARDSYVLSSKVGKLLRDAGTGISPSALFKEALQRDVVFDYSYDGTLRSLAESLERLGLSHIDVLLIHDVNRKYHGDQVNARLDEALAGACRALARLRDERVIGAFGPALNEVDIALRFVAEADVDCVMLPARYTLLDQSAARELLPACAARDVGVLIAAPFDSGILATGARPDAPYNYAPAAADVLDRVARLEAVCARFDVPLAAVALQFPLRHPAVTSVVTGMRSAGEVDANLSLIRMRLPGELWGELQRSGLISPDAKVLE
jgi:D-threo-aldose 1-dehydrogenase